MVVKCTKVGIAVAACSIIVGQTGKSAEVRTKNIETYEHFKVMSVGRSGV